jgi:hypothetical protein
MKTIKNGKHGDLSWHFQDRTLTISGKGSLTRLKSFVYSFLESIDNVIVEHGITSIGESAFDGCENLTSIAIPEDVTSIDDYAFSDCQSLKNIAVKWNTPIEIDADVFKNVDISAITLHVPAGAADAYRNDEVWGEFNIVHEAYGISQQNDMEKRKEGDTRKAESKINRKLNHGHLPNSNY